MQAYGWRPPVWWHSSKIKTSIQSIRMKQWCRFWSIICGVITKTCVKRTMSSQPPERRKRLIEGFKAQEVQVWRSINHNFSENKECKPQASSYNLKKMQGYYLERKCLLWNIAQTSYRYVTWLNLRTSFVSFNVLLVCCMPQFHAKCRALFSHTSLSNESPQKRIVHP